LLLHLLDLRKLDVSFLSAPLLLEAFRLVASKGPLFDFVSVFHEFADVTLNGCD